MTEDPQLDVSSGDPAPELDPTTGDPTPELDPTAGEPGPTSGDPATELEPEPAADGPAPAPPESYEAAAHRLEEIIKRLDSGTAGLRETLDLVKEGRTLVDYCAGELEAVGKGLDELRLDDLIARLDAGQPSDRPA